MVKSVSPKEFPLRYDDGLRGGVALAVSLPPLVGAAIAGLRQDGEVNYALVFAYFCISFTIFFTVYLIWTHYVFDRTAPAEATRIAALQHQRGASLISRLIGMRTSEGWAMSAAFIALFTAGAAAIIGAREGGWWLPLLVLVTVAAAWLTVVYAFALRYFRLHSAGETITFDIAEPPEFQDFVSMSVMISSVAAMTAGTPGTRIGLTAVRTHTFIAFTFNALVLAMAVSLIIGFITGA